MEGATDIAEIAERVESLYDVHMQTRGTSYRGFTSGMKWKSVFRQAAELCVEFGFDPASHVRALDRVPNPRPNMLLGPAAVVRTKRLLETEDEYERDWLNAQFSRLRARLNIGENIVCLLLNECEDFSDSFRFAMAVRLGLPHVASNYRDSARRELKLQPRLVEVMRPLLSEEFLEVLGHGPDGAGAAAPGYPSGT